MVMLLTLTYCGVVWLIFYKLELLAFTKPRKIAVVVLGVGGLLYVLIALGRYMPSMSGAAFVQNPVVEVRTDVGGRVVKVWVTEARDVKKGDPLFQVDPEIYRYQLKLAEAALRQAEENVKVLAAALDAAIADVNTVKAEQEVLAASIDASVANVATEAANVKASQSAHVASQADVKKARVDVRIGEEQYARTKLLVERGAATDSDLDTDTRRIEGAKATLEKMKALEVKGRDAVAAAEATRKSAEAVERQTRSQEATLAAQLTKAEAGEHKARIQLEATIEGEHVTVRQARQNYELAKWNYEHTTTYAPTDGYVVNPQLREGTVVKALDRVMTFVGYGNQIVVALVPQYGAAPIAIGDPVELTFKLYPGRIFKGEVEEIAWATGESQPVLSGQIPRQDQLTPAQSYVVRIRPVDVPEEYPLRFGSAGTAAVYTKNAKAFHVIRKVMLRIEAWTNFLGL